MAGYGILMGGATRRADPVAVVGGALWVENQCRLVRGSALSGLDFIELPRGCDRFRSKPRGAIKLGRP